MKWGIKTEKEVETVEKNERWIGEEGKASTERMVEIAEAFEQSFVKWYVVAFMGSFGGEEVREA